MCSSQRVGQFFPVNHTHIKNSAINTRWMEHETYKRTIPPMKGYKIWTSVGKSGPEVKTGGVTSSIVTVGSPKAWAVNP